MSNITKDELAAMRQRCEAEYYRRFKDYLCDEGFDSHTIRQLDTAVEEVIANALKNSEREKNVPPVVEIASQVMAFDTHDLAEFLNHCGRIMAENEHSPQPSDWLETIVEHVKTDEGVARISDDAQRFILTLTELVERTDEV